MNEAHAQLCASPEWAEYLRTEVLSSVAAGIEFGDELLEVGPGPGAATEWLRARVPRLVAVESDEDAAAVLAERYAGTNVEVIHADATALPFAPASFDSAASFTMLHHVPTVALQNRLLAEVLRVLRPGGVLVGSDSLPSDELHHFHEGDTYNPIEPGAFLTRLQTLGFADIAMAVNREMRFVAHKPE
jgi:SAM-dependent methyltransferase